jgi:hypothetical protein
MRCLTAPGGYRDLPANTSIARHDGGEVVSGYRVSVAQGDNLRDGRASGFIVRRGDLIRGEADYGGTHASRFFDPAANRLPQDAGRLVLAASKALSVEGLLKSAPASGGRRRRGGHHGGPDRGCRTERRRYRFRVRHA